MSLILLSLVIYLFFFFIYLFVVYLEQILVQCQFILTIKSSSFWSLYLKVLCTFWNLSTLTGKNWSCVSSENYLAYSHLIIFYFQAVVVFLATRNFILRNHSRGLIGYWICRVLIPHSSFYYDTYSMKFSHLGLHELPFLSAVHFGSDFLGSVWVPLP